MPIPCAVAVVVVVVVVLILCIVFHMVGAFFDKCPGAQGGMALRSMGCVVVLPELLRIRLAVLDEVVVIVKAFGGREGAGGPAVVTCLRHLIRGNHPIAASFLWMPWT